MDLSGLEAFNQAMQPLFQMSGSMAGTALAAAKNKKIQRLLFQQQKELNDIAFERNLDMMNLQRSWNIEDYNRVKKDTSPEAAVERYREAGMSDAAAVQAAGDITPVTQQVTTHPAPEGSAPSMPSTPWNNMDIDVLGMMRNIQALRKEKVEADNAEQTQLSNINAVLDENEAKHVALQYAIEDLNQFIKTNPYKADTIRYHAEADQFLPETTRLAMKAARVNLKTARENYGYLVNYHKEEIRQIQEEINLAIAKKEREEQETKTAESQEALNRANAGVANATKENIEEQTKGVKQENKGKILTNYSKVVSNVLEKHGNPSSPVQRIAALVEEGILPAEKVGKYLLRAKRYVKQGRDTFSDDPELRAVFVHDIVPAIGEADKVPVWSHGTINVPYRANKSNGTTIGNTWSGIFRPNKK